MGWFEHGGSKIYYEDVGGGAPVLLLPGFAGSIEELSPLAAALSGSFRVVSADLPGSGQSGPQPRSYTPSFYQDDARSLLALLDHLHATPAHVVGFSDGGEDALLMAEVEPQAVRSLVTWGAGGQLVAPPEMLEAMANVVDHPIEPLQGFAEYLKAAYGESNARTMTKSFAAAAGAIAERGGDISRSRASSIACPALLLTGENDFFAPPPLVSEMAGLIPQGQFVAVDGAGHDIHNDRPDWLVQTVLDWLSKH